MPDGHRPIADAEQGFRKALNIDPRNIPALMGLARLALLHGRSDEALALLQRVQAVEPAHPEGLALTGVYWMTKGDFERAVAALEQAKASNPAFPMIHFNLGKAYAGAGRMQAAEGALREAIRLAPDHTDAWCELGNVQANSGRLRDAIHSLLRSIRANRRNVRAYLAVGALYERAGKTALMLRLYRSGLRHNPDAIPLLERIASLHAARFEFRQALAVALQILKRRNGAGDYLRLGTYAVALGDLETAEKAFHKALAKNSTSWEAHYNLAELYMSARLMDKARQHYRSALDAAPSAYEPLNGMGLFTLSVDHDPARAVELLLHAVEAAPSRPEAHLNLALAYAKLGSTTAARESADAVLRLTKPGDALHVQADRLRATLLLQNRPLRPLS